MSVDKPNNLPAVIENKETDTIAHPLNSLVDIVKEGVKATIYLPALAIQVGSPALAIPAAYYSITSSEEGVYEQTMDGITAPEKLWENFKGVPERNEDIINSVEIASKYQSNIDSILSEDTSVFRKGREIAKMWNTDGRSEDSQEITEITGRYIDRQKELLSTYSQGVENMDKKSAQTAGSAVLAGSLYAFLLPFLAKFARIRGKDSLTDRIRKGVYNGGHKIAETGYKILTYPIITLPTKAVQNKKNK